MLYRHLTVLENLKLTASLLQADSSQIQELLTATKLTELQNEPVRELSRGTTQRAAICRCLLNRPELLLLDEPEANLDPTGIKNFNSLLAQRKTTTVVTSHNIDTALKDSDFILGLKASGQKLFAQTAEINRSDIEGLYQ